MKLIALDYDGTSSLDVDMWLKLIPIFKANAYEVVLVTMRTPEEAALIPARLLAAVSRLVCTSRKGKLHYLKSMGITPTFWIDDCPEFILMDSR